jgi:predicted dehydrogenase
MAKLRAAILGAGLISGTKHIPAFLRLKHKVDLVALCDVNREGAEKVADNFGIPHVYADLGELLAREKLDLINICTPPRTHAKLAIQAIKQGTNVLIEKPMAMSVAECDAIISEAQTAGVKVGVAHSDLFYDAFMKARELVDHNVIGEFRGMRIFLSTPTDYMTSRPDHWAHKLPGGVFGESGPHVVYMTLAFINPVLDVAVQGKKVLDYPWSQYEDYRIEIIGEKATNSIVLAYTSNQWMAAVDILGSKGALFLDLQSQSIVKHNRTSLSPPQVGFSELGRGCKQLWATCVNSVRYATGRIRSTHELLIDGFVESIIANRPPPVSAEEGREAVRVMDMIAKKLGMAANKKCLGLIHTESQNRTSCIHVGSQPHPPC